jgi:hypothetical protein
MGRRIKLDIIDGQLILTALIECPQLRIRKRLMTFVIDTGSEQSLLSDAAVKTLQVSLDGKSTHGQIRFGGATYDCIELPKTTFYVLLDDLRTPRKLSVTLTALRTQRISERKRQAAEALPCVLGIQFLQDQGIALHYLPKEKLAYLELEE